MTGPALFYDQNHLPEILPVMNVLVRRGALRKRKRLGNHGLDFPRAVEAEKFVELAAQQGATGKQPPEIHTDQGDVPAHQLERMKPRGLEQGREAAQPAPFSARA